MPVRARIASAWVDQRIRQSGLAERASLVTDLHNAGLDFQSWHGDVIVQARTYASANIASVDAYKERDPARIADCIRAAETIMGHRFDLLGSGPYHPRCPQRLTRAGGYQPINWAYDPVRAASFPEGFSYKDWDLFRDRPENADVKFPWELARCQHFLTLAQAWRVTGEPRFAQEIVDQILDFDEKNPSGVGVNWTCTMDVGIRAGNWALALDLINNCEDLAEEDLFSAYVALFDHGTFIRANLENTYETTSNHYLSNVVGLHVVGAFFQDLPTGQDWIRFADRSVQKEIDVQILPDGADFESSVPYHRLVIELFLASYRLSQHLGTPFSTHFAERLSDMVDYLCGVMTPDGTMPIFGDADDGRFMIATDYTDWNRKDARHLLAPASLSLARDDWRLLAPESGAWEAIWWGFDTATFTPGRMPPPDNVRLYPDAGAAISRTRHAGRYLLATNSIVGTVGFGNHKHNDQLSFEYHDQGIPLIVDTGSWVYTSDFDGRNAHRSTAAHNTLMIDGIEQNEFNPEWLFRMFEKANPKHLHFKDTGQVTIYEGQHSGYVEQLEEGVVHERRFEHDRLTGELRITDKLRGEGNHDLMWSFHFHPDVEVQIAEDTQSALLSAASREWLLTWSLKASVALEEFWFSPSYGVREQNKVLRLRLTDARIPAEAIKFHIRSARSL